MSMPFGQPLSCHQYMCNDVYRHHLLWQASSGKFIHVLAALRQAGHCAICVVLPIFSQMCLCWLLADALSLRQPTPSAPGVIKQHTRL